MAKAKSPRPNPASETPVITMPEAAATPQIRKSPTPVSSISSNTAFSATDLESQIRQRAYELYAERGFAEGFAQEDWYKAEQEILAQSRNRQQRA